MTLPDAYVSSRRFEINELFLVARTQKPCATENGGTSVVMLDEAHQFLDKTIGDEYLRMPFDSFELITSLPY